MILSKKKLDAKNSATLIKGSGSFKSKKISLKKGKKYYIKIEKAHPCNASYDLKIKKVKYTKTERCFITNSI